MIYFVRHGQTDWNVEHRTQGHLDIPLNKTGQNEALECGKKFSLLKIDRIIASDLSRAKETATIINEFLSVPISYDSRLRELNFGDLQGILAKDISDESWDLLNNNPHKIHAESLNDVYKRVKSCLNEIDRKENILIVTHGGVIRMAMYLANYPDSFNQEEFKKNYLEFKIKNTEIFQWNKEQSLQIL